MAPTIHAHGVSFSFGTRTVLHDVELTVTPGMRLGIIGPNGVGKSTLLGVLAGRLRPEAGAVTCHPANATVGELRQEAERDPFERVDAYIARRVGVAAAQAELDASADALAAGEPNADNRYSDALERWLALGAADFETRAEHVVTELGLTAAILASPTDSLSGGQAARVGLAAVLLSRYDVLLLDEPTNDLDFAGLEQLEQFAIAFPGPLVVVSHDRAFLDRVVTHVAEIDEHRHSVAVYAGGWSTFLHEHEVARRHADEAYAKFDTQRAELHVARTREREWAHQGVAKEKKGQRDNDKAGRKFRKEQTEQLAARARRTERAMERLDEVDEPRQSWELRFTIATAPRAVRWSLGSMPPVVERGAFRLGPVQLEVGWGETVGIIGPNGAGKSTLLDALLGRVQLSGGAQWTGPGVIVGEIDQARGDVRRRWPPARTLHGGECATDRRGAHLARQVRARRGPCVAQRGIAVAGRAHAAGLALLQARGVDALVLDEPTNHLDLPAIEQLEAAIAGVPGTVLLVTHDRRLLDAVSVRPHRVRGQRRGDRDVTKRVALLSSAERCCRPVASPARRACGDPTTVREPDRCARSRAC